MTLIEKLGSSVGKWQYDPRTNNLESESVYHDQIGKVWNDENGKLVAQAPEMLEALIEWCLSAEAFGGKLNPKYIISKKIIESATGKTWDEIKQIMEATE